MRRIFASSLLGLVAAAGAGCFSPHLGRCQVSCGAGGACPPSDTCRADGMCHATGDDALCPAAPDGGGAVDGAAAIDARRAVDAAGPADASLLCGNGQLDVGEACDDHNGGGDDGCSASCAIEPGFVCVGEPSTCRRKPAAAGDLVITEIMKDPCAKVGTCMLVDSNAEWFEVTNPTAHDLDLAGLVVKDDGLETFTVTGSLPIAAGGFLVFGVDADPAQNGGVAIDFDYPASFVLGNNADEIELVAPNGGGVTIDRVAYDNGVSFPDTEGFALSLDPGATSSVANDLGASWCASPTVFGAGDHGSPGVANPACP